MNIRLDPDWPLPEEVTTVPGAFLGFLLLDAWIGNTDRHDNNWGVLERSTTDGPIRYLAPTFDHASSLGRELTDEVRHERLTTNDKNRTVEAYIERCRSAFVREEDVEETIHPTEVFQQAAVLYPMRPLPGCIDSNLFNLPPWKRSSIEYPRRESPT